MKYNRQTPCIYKDLKVVFHGIPKNASTSVKNALYEYENGCNFKGNKQWIHKGKSHARGGSIYPEIECIKTKFNDWFHFTVARHPLERFKSFYSDLFANKASGRGSAPKFYSDNKINLNKKTVNEVLDIIESYEDNQADEHFASQFSFIYHDSCRILKIEELAEQWEIVSSQLGVDFKPLPIYNRSDNNLILNDEQKARIYSRYKKDFVKFGYDL